MKIMLFMFCFFFQMLTLFEIHSFESEFVDNNPKFIRKIKATIPDNAKPELVMHFVKMNPFVRYEFTNIHDFKKLHSGQVVYDVNYKIGQGGMRVVPNFKPANQHLIISGDSTVFGVGVLDHQTIPYFLQKKLDSYEVYNWGIGGGGPNNLHYFFDFYGLEKILSKKSKKGVFIYQFEYYLIERIIGTKNFVRWGAGAPYYKDTGEHFVFDGTFEEKWVTKFYQLLNSFSFLDRYIPNLPRIDKEDYQLVARLLLDLGKKYKMATSKDNKFYVVLNPTGLFGYQRHLWEEMKKYFKESGLEFVEIDFEEKRAMDLIPYDGHFSPKGNEYVASRMIELLKLN